MRYIKLVFTFIIMMSMTAAPAAAAGADSGNSSETGSINSVDKNNAYIIFTDPVKKNMMEFIDGNDKTQDADTYNEKVIIEGVQARKVYGANYVYMKVDDSFAKQGENEFMFLLTHYDFGPDKGTYYLEYTANDGKNSVKRIPVIKEKTPKWTTEKVYVNDAAFNHAMAYGCDLKIITGAYNAFAKVEIVNIARAKTNLEFDVGVSNYSQADALHTLGLYKGISKTDYVPGLNEKLTVEQAIVESIKCMGMEKAAKTKVLPCPFKDVSDAAAPYVSYALKIGMIKNDGSGEINGSEYITQRGLIVYFLKALGYNDDNLEENAEKIAEENGVIIGANLIFQLDKAANRDNLVAIAYNCLLAKNLKTNKARFNELLDSGIIGLEQIKKTGDVALSAQIYNEPVKLPSEKVVDNITGREYNYFNLNGSQAVRDYYTAMNWSTDNKRFYISDNEGTIYEYNIETEMVKFIDKGANTTVSPKNNLFYVNKKNELIKMNLDSYKKEKIAELPKYTTGVWGLQVTNDEKRLTLNWTENLDPLDKVNGSLRQRRIVVFDAEKGEWDLRFSHEFAAPYPHANHVIVNPVYNNLIFFAHEGDTQYVHDRIWCLNTDTNEQYNVFKQKKVSDSMTGETSGHETWSADGKNIVFVKYTFPDNIAYSGIVSVDVSGNIRRYINNDYLYWHACASPVSNRWIVADTQIGGGTVEIVLIDNVTGKSYLLAKPILGRGAHPGHAHPSFSYDGKKVWFVMGTGDGVIGTAWMDISDIVDKEAEGSVVQLSDSTQAPSYKDTENYFKKTTLSGVECFRVPKGNSMFVDVKNDKILEERADINIKLTYLDVGRQPLKIRYFGWNEALGKIDKTEAMVYEIKKNYTGKLVTVNVPLKNVSMNNMEKLGTDFKIDSPYSDLFIQNIEVTKQP